MSSALAQQSLVLDGRFRILEPLGGGGMGEVYLAEQVSLGRKVALKVLRQDLSLQPGMIERFKREARLLSSVEHPAVVRVIDFGQTDSATCLVMELAQGKTLRQALEAGPIDPQRAQQLLVQLAEGLAAIHDKGIVHRDLKPDNVVLTQTARGEQARLLDFGIARLADPEPTESNLSQVGLVIGTPEYLSPEQALGAPVELRSDLYSFGVLAFRMLSGALPFPGPTPRQFLAQHVNMAPRSLADAAPRIASNVRLCQLVAWCLQKDVAARPPSAAAILDVLSGRAEVPALPADATGDTWVRPQATTRVEGSPSGQPTPQPSPSDPDRTPIWMLLERGRELRRKAIRTVPPLVRRRALPVGAALLGALAVAYLAFRPQPAAEVRSLIEDGRAREALSLLDAQAKVHGGKLPPPLVGLKAAALHAQGDHDREASTLKSLPQAEVEALDPLALHGLAEDYGRGDTDEPEEVFEHLPKEWLEAQLSKLANDDFSAKQWGALRYLESTGGTKRLDLVKLYIAALKSKSCYVRSTAATRLGELKDDDAEGALKELEESPRPKNLGIFVGSCGHDEASAALKAIAGQE